MKIILYSSGLGYVKRGLESFSSDIFYFLKKSDKKVFLFKGLGEKIDGAFDVWSIRRNSKLYKYFPFFYFQKHSLLIENIIFSIPVFFFVIFQKKCIIFFSETDIANIFLRARNLFKFNYILVFSNGGPGQPSWYSKYDYIHTLTPFQYNEAISFGLKNDRVFMIPYGIETRQFCHAFEKKQLRTDLGLPTDKKIILSVGAINNHHKRMSWLIDEFSNLSSDEYYLLIVGELEVESDSIIGHAKLCLTDDSYSFRSASFSDIPKFYALSDIFVLCSLTEGFGRVYLEAMCSGLFVIAHENENTRFILGKSNPGLIDLSIDRSLSSFISNLNFEDISFIQSANKRRVFEYFSWDILKYKYLEMFHFIESHSEKF